MNTFACEVKQEEQNGDLAQAAVVDSHVHIHDCFDLSSFFNAAYNNFQAAGRDMQLNRFRGVLLLTESEGVTWFQKLWNASALTQAIEWRVHQTQESCSLVVSHPLQRELIIIAGRQIVTREKLEVLALGTDETFPDGRPVRDVLQDVHASNAITVLPWGFGKWIGRRGAIMNDLIASAASPPFYLGDNCGRLALAPIPKHFRLGRQRNIRILPGSNPLPFASEFWRPGSFGFVLYGPISRATPAADLKRCLFDQNTDITRYGKLENPVRFMRNQIAMQVKNRLGKQRSWI